MKNTIQTRPPNSVILVMDRSVGDVPETMAGGAVAATATCVALGTLAASDGETTISLSDETGELPTEEPVFDGVVATPTKVLSVCSVLDDALVELPVPSTETRVRAWTNHESEPDAILIVAVRVSKSIDI